MPPHWTHITINTSDIDASVDFYTSICGLSIVRDRRLEGRHNVWLGPRTALGEDPIFVLVIVQDEVKALLDHFGFQCDTRAEVDRIAELARARTFWLSRQLMLVAWSDTSLPCVIRMVMWLSLLTVNL
jgi:catechol 2,3-dioxygenase-like lactoylglutathione lyase family enzyme